MPPIVFLALGAIALVGALGVARHYGGGHLIDAFNRNVAGYATALRIWLSRLYLTHGVPLIRKCVWYVGAALWAGALIAALVCVYEQRWYNMWIAFVPMAVAFVGVAHMLHIITKRRRSEVSIVAAASATLRYMLLFGVVTLITAQFARSMKLAYIGDLFILGAAGMLYIYIWAFMTVLAKTVGAAEGIADATRHVAWGLITQNDQILQRVFSRETNFGDEASYLPRGKRLVRKLVAAFIPSMVFGTLHPSPAFFFGVHLTGFVVALGYYFLENAGVDTTERRERAAEFFVKISYVFLAIRLSILFFPGLEAAFVLQQNAFEAWLPELVTGRKSVTFPGWKQALPAFIVGALGAWKIYPKTDDAKKSDGLVKSFRKALAVPFALLFAYGALGLVAALFYWSGDSRIPVSFPTAHAGENKTAAAPAPVPAPVVHATVTPPTPQVTPAAPPVTATPPASVPPTPAKKTIATPVDDAIDQLNAKFN